MSASGEFLFDSVLASGNGASETGGAIHVGLTSGALNLRFLNSTISGNEAGWAGSAFHLETKGSNPTLNTEFYNTTIAHNLGRTLSTARKDGSTPEKNTVRFRNSLLAGVTGSVCYGASSGTLESLGWLVHPGDASCSIVAGTGDMIRGVAVLPLFDNGGDTLTHAMGSANPINSGGEPGGCTIDGSISIPVDQRGFTRTTANCTPGAWSQ